jgi:hypothetical protein
MLTRAAASAPGVPAPISSPYCNHYVLYDVIAKSRQVVAKPGPRLHQHEKYCTDLDDRQRYRFYRGAYRMKKPEPILVRRPLEQT